MFWIVLACSEEIKDVSEPSVDSDSPQEDTAQVIVDTAERNPDTISGTRPALPTRQPPCALGDVATSVAKSCS